MLLAVWIVRFTSIWTRVLYQYLEAHEGGQEPTVGEGLTWYTQRDCLSATPALRFPYHNTSLRHRSSWTPATIYWLFCLIVSSMTASRQT